MIMTIMEHRDSKAYAINKTWAQDCDSYVFVTKPKDYDLKVGIEVHDENFLPMLYLPNYEESYVDLTDKVYETFKYVYSKYPNYDWYVKADDDTFMLIDNLRGFLKNKKPMIPVTFGMSLETTDSDDIETSYLLGGAGYVISNMAFKLISDRLLNENGFCQNSGQEDIDVGKCFRKLSVYAENSRDEQNRERFQAFGLKVIFDGKYPSWIYNKYKRHLLKKGVEAFSDSSISFHEMTPANMIKFYQFWKASKKHISGKTKTFGDLVDIYLKIV
jgi:glycoprotein-N-acetylgalactosamine 3-beta-galactosyltransferase